ncbi:MAG: hypothetical protein HY558_07860 [Euryarchaeota archaeon]|nr:hypothetical protein [Euryarchaeota archaeon]
MNKLLLGLVGCIIWLAGTFLSLTLLIHLSFQLALIGGAMSMPAVFLISIGSLGLYQRSPHVLFRVSAVAGIVFSGISAGTNVLFFASGESISTLAFNPLSSPTGQAMVAAGVVVGLTLLAFAICLGIGLIIRRKNLGNGLAVAAGIFLILLVFIPVIGPLLLLGVFGKTIGSRTKPPTSPTITP